jgi:hypothetical protein
MYPNVNSRTLNTKPKTLNPQPSLYVLLRRSLSGGTNKAALNLSGSTIHSFLRLDKEGKIKLSFLQQLKQDKVTHIATDVGIHVGRGGINKGLSVGHGTGHVG